MTGPSLWSQRLAWADLAAALREVDRQAATAATLLTGPFDGGEAEDAERCLSQIEDLLADLAWASDVGDTAGSRLLAVRDELSGYLLAVAALYAIGLSADAVPDVLRRAAGAVRAGIAALGQDEQLISGRT
jgi:hypothetical protein